MTNTVGAIISVLASVISNLGTNIQKEAHLQNEARADDQKIPYLKSCLWWLGLVGVVAGSIGDFVAFSLASQELVVAVGCAAVLLCNVAVSTVWHKEAMGWTDFMGIICVLAAAVIFALNAPVSEDLSAAELADKFQRSAFALVLVLQMICIFTLLSAVSSSSVFAMRIKCQYRCFRHLFRRYDKVERQNELLIEQCKLLDNRLVKMERYLTKQQPLTKNGEAGNPSELPPLLCESPREQFVSPIGAWDTDRGENKLPMRRTFSTFSDPSLQRSSMLSQELIVDDEDREDDRSWDPYIYAACSGTAGGMMALFAGCASKALKQTMNGDNQFDSPWTYMFVVGLVAFIMAQTHFLNRAMIEGDLTSVIPTFQAFWIVFGVVSGMAFYDNSAGMSFPGLFLMIAGVVFLLQHPKVVAGNDVFGIKSCCISIGCLSKPNENVAELDLEAKGDTPPTTLEDEVCTHAKNPVLEAKGDTPPTALEDEICTRARNPVREVTPLHSPPPSPPSKHPPNPQVAAAQGATVTPEMLLGSSAESP